MPRTSITEAEIREALLKAATEAFLRDGIMATEMKAVAASAGLSRSTLYRYAISKNQLAFLVGEQRIRLMVEAAHRRSGTQLATGWERLEYFCESMITELEGRTADLRLMAEFDAIYSGPYPDIPEARDYVATMQRLHSHSVQMVMDGLADGSIVNVPDAALFASVLENVIFGMATRYFPREAHYIEEHQHGGRQVIREIVRRLLEGVRAA